MCPPSPAAGVPLRITMLALTLAAAAMLSGCATTNATNATNATMANWLATHGGIANDAPHRHRAQTALARLLPTPAARPLTVAVLDTDQVGAFVWPTGQIFVTRALIDLASQDELTAALAHELGHLPPTPQPGTVTALKGHATSLQSEINADTRARQILADANVPADALQTLLEKLSTDPRLSPQKRNDLRHRAQRLNIATAGIAPATPGSERYRGPGRLP